MSKNDDSEGDLEQLLLPFPNIVRTHTEQQWLTDKQIERLRQKQQLITFWLEEIEDHIWSEDFQYDFFESLQKQFHQTQWLSDKQIECLGRLYERVTTDDVCL